jgi:hypothetical protein
LIENICFDKSASRESLNESNNNKLTNPVGKKRSLLEFFSLSFGKPSKRPREKKLKQLLQLNVQLKKTSAIEPNFHKSLEIKIQLNIFMNESEDSFVAIVNQFRLRKKVSWWKKKRMSDSERCRDIIGGISWKHLHVSFASS